MHEGMHLFPCIKVANMACKQRVLRTAWLWLNKNNPFFGKPFFAGPELLT